MSKLSETMREYNYGATGATIMGWSIQVAGLEDRNGALEMERDEARQEAAFLKCHWFPPIDDIEQELVDLRKRLEEVLKTVSDAEEDLRLRVNPYMEENGLHPATLTQTTLAALAGKEMSPVERLGGARPIGDISHAPQGPTEAGKEGA